VEAESLSQATHHERLAQSALPSNNDRHKQVRRNLFDEILVADDHARHLAFRSSKSDGRVALFFDFCHRFMSSFP
jgi:hypothetical protein